jgi:hypothetical protein
MPAAKAIGSHAYFTVHYLLLSGVGVQSAGSGFACSAADLWGLILRSRLQK